eukprot:TRINITY_DN21966_c0_g1_i1.p1 TRINITY_DN21966_c0_g1~~TRINITY_DN21966_c0_g1_i1.p1  ORF type:complete len:273 (-),score=36.35 TRINITY_DN21966_c0_g1_i1:326-1144(-)
MCPSFAFALLKLFSTVLKVSSAEGVFETCSAGQQESILGGIQSCKPIETVVPLEFYPNENYSFVKPKYVSVQRCQGSCFSNNHHSCMATNSKSRDVEVLIYPRSPHSDGTLSPTCSSMSVQDHVACACGCSVTQADCEDEGRGLRTYLPGECRCACRDVSQRSTCLREGHYWNAQTCECMCLNPQAWPICPTGYSFDYGIGACHCAPPAEVASLLLEITLVLALVAGVIILWSVVKTCLASTYIHSFRSRLFSRMESESEEREELRFFDGQS